MSLARSWIMWTSSALCCACQRAEHGTVSSHPVPTLIPNARQPSHTLDGRGRPAHCVRSDTLLTATNVGYLGSGDDPYGSRPRRPAIVSRGSANIGIGTLKLSVTPISFSAEGYGTVCPMSFVTKSAPSTSSGAFMSISRSMTAEGNSKPPITMAMASPGDLCPTPGLRSAKLKV